MSKKALQFANAERMYVREMCTCMEIAASCHISEKTVRLWKDEGQWDVQRANNTRSQKLFAEELYEFSRALLKNIMSDMKEGKPVSDARLYTLCRLCPQLLNVKEYEDTLRKNGIADAPVTREEILERVDKAIRGGDITK